MQVQTPAFTRCQLRDYSSTAENRREGITPIRIRHTKRRGLIPHMWKELGNKWVDVVFQNLTSNSARFVSRHFEQYSKAGAIKEER